MTYLSVKALRHYHDVGLLEPVDIDSATGYRRYSTAQVSTAQAIRRFRELDMPIEHVQSSPRRARCHEPQRGDPRPPASHAAATRANPDDGRFTAGTARGRPTHVHRDSPIHRTDVVARDQRDGGVRRQRRVVRRGVRRAPRRAHRRRAHACRPGRCAVLQRLLRARTRQGGRLRADHRRHGPTGRTERLDLPAADFAVLVHEGPFADLDRTYGALGTHVALQRIGVDGPIREHYVVAGDDVDPGDHRTEVCWPITVQPTT